MAGQRRREIARANKKSREGRKGTSGGREGEGGVEGCQRRTAGSTVEAIERRVGPIHVDRAREGAGDVVEGARMREHTIDMALVDNCNKHGLEGKLGKIGLAGVLAEAGHPHQITARESEHLPDGRERRDAGIHQRRCEPYRSTRRRIIGNTCEKDEQRND